MLAKSLNLLCLVVFELLLSNHNIVQVFSYNLHAHPVIVLSDPQLLTQTPETRSSYFGFSLVLRDESIIIGAPRGRNPEIPTGAQLWSNEIGVVWRCLLSQQKCEQFDLLPDPGTSITTNQWLASTMDGGSGHTDNDMLVVCAPRFAFREEDDMQGICYWSQNTRRNNINNVPFSKINTFESALPKKLDKGLKKTWWALQGISLHVVQNSTEILMGAIGTNLYKGSVVFFNTLSSSFSLYRYKRKSFSYFGYAVASGNLGSTGAGSKPSLLYVATAPRGANLYGEAIVMDKTQVRAVLNGTQYGDYFGYAALVVDVNGDGMDDILITAPQYASDVLDDQYDNGALYVFLNKGDTNFERSTIVSPFLDAGRFGTTITNLGDINLDGYNDVAVGAPFTEEHGAVAIYLGSANGLTTRPSQVLAGSDVPTLRGGMFGHGLSKGVDIDGNGFNDFAVGAPESASVYVYKAYPVVRIVATLQTKTLNLERQLGEQIVLEVCHRIETNSTKIVKRNIEITLNMDAHLQRAHFNSNTPSSKHEVIVESSKTTTQCFNVTASTVLIKLANRPLKTSMEYRLASFENPGASDKNFCEHCVVVDPRDRYSTSVTIPFQTDCGTYCKVELKVSLISAPTNITLGIDKFIVMRYEVENSGQMSFDATLRIVATTSMPFSKFPAMCNEWNDNAGMRQLVCYLAQGKEFQGNSTVEIIFDATSQRDEEELRMNVKIGSDSGVEVNKMDNEVLHSVQVLRNSYITIEGKPKNNYIDLRRAAKVQQMEYNVKIFNHGPSSLIKHRLNILFPVGLTATTGGEPMHLVNISTMHLYTTAEGQNSRYLDFELLDVQPTPTNQPSQDEVIASNKRVLSCHNTTQFVCVQAQMELELSSGHEIQLDLKYDANIDVADYLTRSFDYLVLEMDVTVESATPLNGNIEQIKNLDTTIMVHLKEQKTPLWVYILSALGGLLVLIPVIFGLSKANFFKRQTQEDMEKTLQKKAEKIQMEQ